MLVNKMYFEDGTTALMPPVPIRIEGLIVMSSMAIFHKQVKGVTGCSAILEPAAAPTHNATRLNNATHLDASVARGHTTTGFSSDVTGRAARDE